MYEAKFHLESVTPYGPGKFYEVPKLPKELSKDYEIRTWRERCNYDKEGFVFFPRMGFKYCLISASAFLDEQIPGKGKRTYKKRFEAGIDIIEDLHLPFRKDEVEGEWFMVPSDGKAGGTTRVPKCFPVIPTWDGDLRILVMDDLITKPVLEKHVAEAGKFVGIGRFRPERRGFYGRFIYTSVEYTERG
jgi:hypothetical protein